MGEILDIVEVGDPCPKCDGQLRTVGVPPHDRIKCSFCGADLGEVTVHEL